MRIASWNPEEFAPEILSGAMDRIRKCGAVVRDAARAKVPVWNGKSHGPYKSGAYAGEIWTARDYRNLKETIRVSEKKSTSPEFGFKVAKDMNVWVISGNFRSWYAVQVEFGRGGWKGGPHPFLRPAFNGSVGQMKTIIENG